MSLVYCLFASRTECEYLGVLPIIAYSGRLHSTIFLTSTVSTFAFWLNIYEDYGSDHGILEKDRRFFYLK